MIVVKAGASFAYNGQIRLPPKSKPGVLPVVKGDPVDITDWVITSAISYRNKPVATLTATITDPAQGTFLLKAPAGTASWMIAVLDCDLKYVSPFGDIVYTDTFAIDCRKAVTP